VNIVTVSANDLKIIPTAWKKKLGGDNFELQLNKKSISIRPRAVEKMDCWNASRDNNGKAIPTKKILKTLKKIRKEEDGQK